MLANRPMTTLEATKTQTQTRTREAVVRIPLSALRCILRYPKEKKIVCEVNIEGIERLNEAETLDEIINQARLDYAMGSYKTFASAKDLITELHS